LILGGVGVVFLTRKGGVQTLPISVEDFWGGLLAGFLVAFFGGEYIGKVFGVESGTDNTTG
jgi:uncharacterized membrane protein